MRNKRVIKCTPQNVYGFNNSTTCFREQMNVIEKDAFKSLHRFKFGAFVSFA